MKIVEINAVPYGSTGNIARNIADICKPLGETYFAYSWTKKRKSNVKNDEILIGTFLGKSIHIVLSRITGWELNFSFFDTLFFIKKLKKIKPDVIHLHNIHCWYLNIPLLFKYIKKNNIKVIWTLHDCWSFTGHCPHFDGIGCCKWKKGCFNCPLYKYYPESLFDNSKKMYEFKKKWFTYLDDVTLVTPSKWLANLTRSSYLNKYPVEVINNGIDLNVFKSLKSDFRKKHHLENKIILLGVSFIWKKEKGLDYFIKLANDLPDNYQIVLVGTDDNIDKILPKNILSIHKTDSQKELAELYSTSDLFINPTLEDNYPTVNMESIACGTPVITFNTGGSPESMMNFGYVVEKDNYKELKNKILNYKNIKNNLDKKCIDKNVKFKEYYQLLKGTK